MGKELWKPGNMLYPLPAVMVSLADQEGHPNIITLAWVGTVCTNPPMVSISVRPERYSYPILKETGEFVINLTTKELVYATDYCGVRSGRDVDKFKEMKLTAVPASVVKAPMIGESPVNIECKVRQIMPLGSHDMFLADVVAVHADEKYMDETTSSIWNRRNRSCILMDPTLAAENYWAPSGTVSGKKELDVWHQVGYHKHKYLFTTKK